MHRLLLLHVVVTGRDDVIADGLKDSTVWNDEPVNAIDSMSAALTVGFLDFIIPIDITGDDENGVCESFQ